MKAVSDMFYEKIINVRMFVLYIFFTILQIFFLDSILFRSYTIQYINIMNIFSGRNYKNVIP